jgi:CBS domain-containing protein
MIDTSRVLKPVLSFLYHYKPFSQMSLTHQEYLAMHLEQVFFAEGDSILSSREGRVETFYIIKSGLVCAENKMAINAQETLQPVIILEPGDCFPLTALINKRAVNFQHRALKSTICYKLKHYHFEYLMQQSTTFHNFIFANIAP